MNGLAHWERSFGRVGWFIPPYIQMGVLARMAAAIEEAGDAFTQSDLAEQLSDLYSPIGLATMVLHRYPAIPVIQDYAVTIEEAVEAHFLGLDHVAAAGLIPVIEGAARRHAQTRDITSAHIKDVITDLAESCKNDGFGAADEVASMMDSFVRFAREALFERSDRYIFGDGTNRHGITHGAYTDTDYGSPINFYKTIAAVDFLTFIASFRATISWVAPSATDASLRRAMYYCDLRSIRRAKALGVTA